MKYQSTFPFLLAFFLLIGVLSCTQNCEKHEVKNEMCWWYNQLTQKYWEGLRIGTGRFAAMIEGKVHREKIFFNDETLWSGRPYDSNNPKGPKILKDIRKSILAGDYVQATKQSWQLGSIPERAQQYQHMGILDLEFEGDSTAKFQNYRRKLSMDNALVSVSYQINHVNYRREIFASYPNQVIVMQLSADQTGMINVKCRLSSLQPSAKTRIDHEDLVLQGSAETLTGERYEANGKPLTSEIKWQARLMVIPDGGMRVYDEEEQTISIHDANSVELVLAGTTNWVSWNDVPAGEKKRLNEYMSKASRLSYSELKQKHLADYMPLFSACQLDLGSNDAAKLNTTERLDRLRNGGDDPLFISQYFQYGRYFMLAAARENTLALSI